MRDYRKKRGKCIPELTWQKARRTAVMRGGMALESIRDSKRKV